MKKVVLQPGHSPLDWARKMASFKVKNLGRITMEQLEMHDNQNDAWICINGTVYDMTNYIDFHPGGVDEILRGAGTDATELFSTRFLTSFYSPMG